MMMMIIYRVLNSRRPTVQASTDLPELQRFLFHLCCCLTTTTNTRIHTISGSIRVCSTLVGAAAALEPSGDELRIVCERAVRSRGRHHPQAPPAAVPPTKFLLRGIE